MKKSKIGKYLGKYDTGDEYTVNIYQVNENMVAIELPEKLKGYSGLETLRADSVFVVTGLYKQLLEDYLKNGVEFEMEE